MGKKNPLQSGSLDGRIRIDDSRGTITILDDGNVPIMLIGKLPADPYGIAVAKPGENVLDSF